MAKKTQVKSTSKTKKSYYQKKGTKKQQAIKAVGTKEASARMLFEKLNDPYWRINNLYSVINKEGNRVTFKLNQFQEKLYQEMHNLNIILKARQLGMTTFIAIYFLDQCLFKRNQNAATIAHTKDDAQKIFESKIKFAWENLPQELRSRIGVDTETVREFHFKFTNSRVRVTTSARSGTLQLLHISELGVLAAKYPIKAREVVTGSLNTVAPGQKIFIESTAKGEDGPFYDICKRAMDLEKEGLPLTSMDYKFFFFPWWEAKEYVLPGDVIIPIEFQKYFTDLYNKYGIELTREQKSWYIKKAETQGDDMKSEYPSVPEEAFSSSIEGSYYGALMDKMRTENRVTSVPWEPNIVVDTWWDLGMDDTNSIVFVQRVGREMHIIDHYESSGEGFIHYAKILKEKPYVYGTHFFPHDAEVKELGSGKSRKDSALSLGISPIVVTPRLRVIEGIEAVRNILPKTWIDKTKADKIIKSLSNYRKDWDEKFGRWRDVPRHDEWSHACDAIRTGALSLYMPLQQDDEDSIIDNINVDSYDKHSVIGLPF